MKFSQLCSKYQYMRQPALGLKVGQQELKLGVGAALNSLVCELTSRPQAGLLRLQLELDTGSALGQSWLSTLQLGAAGTLSLGYDTDTTQVFHGFLYDISWDYPPRNGVIQAEAVFLDVRGKLMLSASATTAATLSKLVKGLVDHGSGGGLKVSTTVKDPPESWNLPARQLGESDYDMLCRIAAFLCYECCVWADKLYFGPPRSNTAATVTFEGENGLLQLTRRRTLAGQCASVTVGGSDLTGGAITARSSRTRDSGYGVGSVSALLSRPLWQPEPGITTMAQAKYLAKARMQERQRQSGAINGRCVGLPQIVPGRFLAISEASPQVNGTYYIHTVRHILDRTGFETQFEGED